MKRFIAATLLALVATSCAIPKRSPTAPPVAVPTAVPDNPISEIAQREILRRQERIRQMDATALEANRALSENDLEGAVSGFRQASGVTP
jgi:hypothetical protein